MGLICILLLPAPALAQSAPTAEPEETEAQPLDPAGSTPTIEEEEPSYEGTAEVEAPAHEPTKRTLARKQLTTVPGTRGDAFRAIEIMPGVGRTQFGTNPGPPLLRGSPSSEGLVLIDGAQIPLLYHMGGLTSVFNSHLLESVTLYPGNYSARHGRAAGGIVDARVRDPRLDAPHLLFDVSALDSSVVGELPLGQNTGLALAARRSTVDLFFDALISDDSTAVIAAPVYWDYQAILAHRFNQRHKLRLVAFGGSDAFELHFGEALADDPALQGNFGSEVSFHRLQLELDSQLSDRVTQHLRVSSGPSPGVGQLGSVTYDYDSWDSSGQASWSFLLAPWLTLDTGVDAQLVNVDFVFNGPAPAPDEGVPTQGSLASETETTVRGPMDAVRPGGFVEASVRPTPELLLVPGVRVDYFADGRDWTIDPRLTSRLALGPNTTLKAGAGFYSQPPQYWEVFPEFGNPNVAPYKTLQASVGVQQLLGTAVRTDVDVFYRHWIDRIVGTPGGAPPIYINQGTGDAYGLELLLDVQAGERGHGYLAYTLSRSTRQDAPGAPTRLFDDDQTHNLSLAGSYDLGAGWTAGARFRFVTGNPYSAVSGSVYDASTDTYRPLYSSINGARNPAFHQLDLRVEKLWDLGTFDLSAYLEVMNVYNQQNQESRRYSFDYQESASVAGMPLFPNLGIKGEL